MAKEFKSAPNFPEDAKRKEELDILTQRRTIEDELTQSGVRGSARGQQLQNELLSNEVAVTFEGQLQKIQKEAKEADMRVMENINHIIHQNIEREPDLTAHCESSALFFQKKLEVLTRTEELILRQIQIKKAKQLAANQHHREMERLEDAERKLESQ